MVNSTIPDIEQLTARIASAGGVSTEPQSITSFFELPPPVLFKSADRETNRAAGEEVTYSYVVVNQGSAPVGGPILVKDDIADVKCPDIKQVGDEKGLLGPGQSITCTATYTITDADVRKGSVTNTAVAYLGESTSEPKSTTIFFKIEPSNLTLSESAKPETYQEVGQIIHYTYFISNDGKYPLKGPLTVKDDQTKVNCPEINTTGDGDVVLDPGERLTCTAVYTITNLDVQNGSVTNSARASMDAVDSNPDSVTVNEMGLDLEITADHENYETAGDTIKYTYVITGKSKEPLNGPLTITRENDRMKVDCPAFKTVGNGDNFLDWRETITCTGQYAITQADIDTAQPDSDHGAVTTTAWANVGGINSKQVTATVAGPVQRPVLSLAMTTDLTKFDSVDQKITYTYTITNDGNVTIFSPLQVADDHVNNGKPFNCGADNQLAPAHS